MIELDKQTAKSQAAAIMEGWRRARTSRARKEYLRSITTVIELRALLHAHLLLHGTNQIDARYVGQPVLIGDLVFHVSLGRRMGDVVLYDISVHVADDPKNTAHFNHTVGIG